MVQIHSPRPLQQGPAVSVRDDSHFSRFRYLPHESFCQKFAKSAGRLTTWVLNGRGHEILVPVTAFGGRSQPSWFCTAGAAAVSPLAVVWAILSCKLSPTRYHARHLLIDADGTIKPKCPKVWAAFFCHQLPSTARWHCPSTGSFARRYAKPFYAAHFERDCASRRRAILQPNCACLETSW